MNILKINIVNFRNLNNQEINLLDGINLFYGKNAQGKTSILEALYFAAMGISFRTKKIAEIVKYENDKLGVYIEVKDTIGISSRFIKCINKNSNNKQFYINNKNKTQSEYFGGVNIIVYVPEDIEIINGSPQDRRNFFDIEISQIDKLYLEDLKNYNKILKIRNKLIKERKENSSEFKLYNKAFISYVAKIIYKRWKYIKELSSILNKNYKKLFIESEDLFLQYKSIVEIADNDSIKDLELKIDKKLESSKERELKFGYTLYGAHKDEFIFSLKDNDAKISASQGEKKSIIFALKLSEIFIIEKFKNESPIIMIDDITSYFDSERRKSIIDFLIDKKMQVIISSTDDIEIIGKKFFVEKGVIDEFS